MRASTELINAYNFTPANMDTWIALLQQQKIDFFIFRLNAFSEGLGTTSGGINTAKALILKCNAANIKVAIDLHTWCKGGTASWDAAFDDNVAAHETNRAKYITYVRNVLTAFQGSNVAAFMVMNEPQAQRASASESQFILDVIAAAKESTNAPVSVRFMGSASPSTGHYAAEIDAECDFICRNMYWAGTTYFDPRTPNLTAENAMLDAADVAHASGKAFWLTEFGKSKSNLESQRSYVAAVVGWAVYRGLDAVFCWASQPSQSGETYNIFTGWTPHAAFYELVSGEPPHPECAVDLDCNAIYGAPPAGKKWLCQDGTCVLADLPPQPECSVNLDCDAKYGPPPSGKTWVCQNQICVLADLPIQYWKLNIGKSGSGDTDPQTGRYEYATDQSAVVTSFPADGWILDHWEIDGRIVSGSTAQVVVVPQLANSEHTLTAYFIESPVHVCPTGYHWDEATQVCVKDKNGCFIATACGTSNTHLSTLRRFRDHCLPLPLVHAYYRSSPPLADRIRQHENIKTVFRKVFEWLASSMEVKR